MLSQTELVIAQSELVLLIIIKLIEGRLAEIMGDMRV